MEDPNTKTPTKIYLKNEGRKKIKHRKKLCPCGFMETPNVTEFSEMINKAYLLPYSGSSKTSKSDSTARRVQFLCHLVVRFGIIYYWYEMIQLHIRYSLQKNL